MAYDQAVERIRGRMSASDATKRGFVEAILSEGVRQKVFRSWSLEDAPLSKVYRLELTSGGTVGLIRKGCPDGNHMNRWSRPAWASELFLWWLCPTSQVRDPGANIWKGIARYRSRLQRSRREQLDGVIFHDQLCGTPQRPCPKKRTKLILNDIAIPAPCLYVLPQIPETAGRHNWRGERQLEFPPALLGLFGVSRTASDYYTGFVGLETTSTGISRTRVTARFGEGQISSHTTSRRLQR